MSDKPVEKVIKNAIKLLREIYPKNTYLYFPLLSTALIWAVRRPQEWKESVFSWQIWPDPDYIKAKPNDYVLEFFSGHPLLQKEYSEEIERKDWKTLRAVFIRLYPIFGLEDPFLMALFRKEIEANNFSGIVLEFDHRVEKAKEDIQAIKKDQKLLAALRAFGEEMASFITTLLAESEVQRSLQDILEAELKGKND